MPLSRPTSRGFESSSSGSRNKNNTAMTSNRFQTSSRTSCPRTSSPTSSRTSRHHANGRSGNRVEKLRHPASSHTHVNARQRERGQGSKISAFVNRFLRGGIFMEMASNLYQCPNFLWQKLTSSTRDDPMGDVGSTDEDLLSSDKNTNGCLAASEDEHKTSGIEAGISHPDMEIERMQVDEAPAGMTPATQSFFMEVSEGGIIKFLAALSEDQAQQLQGIYQSEQRILAYTLEMDSLGLPELELQICSAIDILKEASLEPGYDNDIERLHTDLEELERQRGILQTRRKDLSDQIKSEQDKITERMKFVGCSEVRRYQENRERIYKDLYDMRKAVLAADDALVKNRRAEERVWNYHKRQIAEGNSKYTLTQVTQAIQWRAQNLHKQLRDAEADLEAVKRQARELGLSFWDPDQESGFIDREDDGYRESEDAEEVASVNREEIHRWMDCEDGFGIPECDDWDFYEVGFGESCGQVAEGKERKRIDRYQKMCHELRVERNAMVEK